MQIFDLISLMDREVVPGNSKIHLATWNGQTNPLDVYLAGEFDEWQRWQTRRNFERPFVISLIALRGLNRWLFAGVHTSHGQEWKEAHGCFRYDLREHPTCSELNGRMVASFARPGRQSYLNAENWADRIELSEVLPERLKIAEFPGFRAVNLSKAELDLIVRQDLESWRTALSNVAGVYLITDTLSGKLYVGSATGGGGIWQRWTEYAASGHGGNLELSRLVRDEGNERVFSFRFSILETADIHASKEEVLRRESHWKNVLLTREHGLNSN
ncbi:MAG TPA: GIY-YIG nuclease family protein [Longimicrobium sp.]|jgi:hypothetical protein